MNEASRCFQFESLIGEAVFADRGDRMRRLGKLASMWRTMAQCGFSVSSDKMYKRPDLMFWG